MTIADFAKATGVPAHSLRRLHTNGKLVPAVVLDSGHRRYEEWQIEDAVQYIKKLKLLPGGKNVIVDIRPLGGFFSHLLGVVMADGTVLESGQVQLEMKDRQILDDLAAVLGCVVHKVVRPSRSDKTMFRITVPRPVAIKLVEYGVCRRKSQGFDVPDMCENDFCHFLRGLFDGDGSTSSRESRLTLRFHGHPKAMAYIQKTLMEHFGLYMPWVKDNRLESGMLESSRKSVVSSVCRLMYSDGGIFLKRKHVLNSPKKE